MPATYAAAIVPDDDPRRPWDVAAELAVEWIEQQPGRPVLITAAKNNIADGVPALARLLRHGEHTTRRSGRVDPASGGRPVLAYVPHLEDMEYARTIAGGNALAVVETTSCPLSGWASAVAALNLITGQTVSPVDHPGFDDWFDMLLFAGNNGYADDYGKRDAQRLLGEPTAAAVGKETILGGLIANGISADGVNRIAALIDKVSPSHQAAQPQSRDW